MKKRLALIIVALVSVIVMSILFISCSDETNTDEKNETYTVSYHASTGGYLSYVDEQEHKKELYANFNVQSGGDVVEVTSYPAVGYVFVGWSDGVTTPTRHDINVTQNINALAQFRMLEYTVKYFAGEHGRIDGEVEQTVEYNGYSATVTAVPDKGYKFVKWSDGVTTAERNDIYVTEDVQATAEFAIISREYVLNYRLNSETELNKPTVNWTYGELEGVKLPVLEKEHFTFGGWYYDDTKIADENGELLIDDDFLIQEVKKYVTGKEKDIEAKWIAEESYTYKVLLVYVTKIEADLMDRKLNMQHVEFQMTDEQKRFCHANTKMFEQYMEDMTDGLVDFEVDEYFTTQTVYSESFQQGTPTSTTLLTRLYPSYIPEVSATDMTKGYDASVSVFGFCDDISAVEAENKFESAGGSSNPLLEGECEVYLDAVWRWIFTRGVTIDDVLSDKSGKYLHDWRVFLDSFAHEIAHTIETRINIYNYHGTIGIWGININIGSSRNNKMYYLNELILDGERIGIPYGYWKGEIATVTYEMSTGEDGNMGYITYVTPRNPFYTPDKVQRVVYGYDAVAVVAKPYPGQRFVRWSDGVTTSERWDKNITADFTVTAIFEPIVYTINVVASEGGGVKKGLSGEVQQTISSSVKYRTFTGQFYAVAQEGYRFVGWSDGTTDSVWEKIVQGSAFLNLFDENDSYTLTAIFEKIE